MIESIVVALLIANIIMFMWSYEKQEYMLFIMNAVMWLILGAFTFQITVPGDTAYYFGALLWFCLGYAFVDIVFAVRWIITSLVSPKIDEKNQERRMHAEMLSQRHNRRL